MNRFLTKAKYLLLGTVVVSLTLLLYVPALLLSLVTSKVRVKGFTIMVGEVGKEIFGLGFGW